MLLRGQHWCGHTGEAAVGVLPLCGGDMSFMASIPEQVVLAVSLLCLCHGHHHLCRQLHFCKFMVLGVWEFLKTWKGAHGQGVEGVTGRLRATSPLFTGFEPFLKFEKVIWWPFPLILLSEHLLNTY